jgi:hypothetical protein
MTTEIKFPRQLLMQNMRYQLLRPGTTFFFSYVFATSQITNIDKLLKICEEQMKESNVHYNRIFNPMPRWDKCVNVTDDHIENC